MADVWILVADRARARLFSLEKGAPRMIEIADFVNPEARTPGHEQRHSPPPRVHDRIGESRHAIEAHTSPREKAALRFAAVLGTHLEEAYAGRRYRNLVLIAPPGFLGILKAVLGSRLIDSVVLEIPKNLTRSQAVAIQALLPRTLFRHGLTVTRE